MLLKDDCKPAGSPPVIPLTVLVRADMLGRDETELVKLVIVDILTLEVNPVTLSVILFGIPEIDASGLPPIPPASPAPAVNIVAVIAPAQAMLSPRYYNIVTTICSCMKTSVW
jgi:hypothetical protein